MSIQGKEIPVRGVSVMAEANMHSQPIKGKRLENLLAARETIPLGRDLITLRDDCAIDFDLAATEARRTELAAVR